MPLPILPDTHRWIDGGAVVQFIGTNVRGADKQTMYCWDADTDARVTDLYDQNGQATTEILVVDNTFRAGVPKAILKPMFSVGASGQRFAGNDWQAVADAKASAQSAQDAANLVGAPADAAIAAAVTPGSGSQTDQKLAAEYVSKTGPELVGKADQADLDATNADVAALQTGKADRSDLDATNVKVNALRPRQDTIMRDKINASVVRGKPATASLTIPTHVSPAGGQVTHPSVLYFPGGWNGYEYWMAITPYPAGNDDHEDPNIVASHDGLVWEVPAGLVNPLDDSDGTPEYNSDTELVMSPDQTTMYCVWRFYENPGLEQFWMRTSTDGVTWTPKQLVYSVADTVRRLMSPTLVWENNQWVLWAVDILRSPNVIVRMTAPDLTGPWSAPTDCTVTGLLAGKEPWHLQVRKLGDQYVGLLADCTLDQNGAGGELYFMTSDNGLAWTCSPPVIPKANAGLYDQLYRSSLVPCLRNGVLGFDVWYTGWLTGPPTVWNLYKTHVTTQPEASTVRVALTGLAVAASGSNHQDVTFPPGAFTKPPFVSVTADNSRLTVGAALVTKTGCRILIQNWTTGAVAGATVEYRATED